MRVMSGAMKKLGIDQLNTEQRLSLIEEIWESIDADDSSAVQLSDAQRAELRTRLAEDDANPEENRSHAAGNDPRPISGSRAA